MKDRMIHTRHCDLCEYPKRNLKKGLTCGLTDKKPDFKVFCSKIKFSNSLKENVSELLNSIEQSKKRRKYVYLNFGFFTLVGLIIIIRSYPYLTSYLHQAFEPEFNYKYWKYFSLILGLNIAGIFLIKMGFWPFKKFRKELKKLESERREIDMILKNYGMEAEKIMALEQNHRSA